MKRDKKKGREKNKQTKLISKRKDRKKINRKNYEKVAKKYRSIIQKEKERINQLRKIESFLVPAILIIAIFSVLFFYKPSITGFFSFEDTEEYVHEVNQLFDKNSSYIFVPEVDGEMKSLMINGKVLGEGIVRVYLETENESYLVFEYSKEEVESNQITGMAVQDMAEDENNESVGVNNTDEINETEEINQTSDTNETDDGINESDEINESKEINETSDTEDIGSINESDEINETDDIINESKEINETEEILNETDILDLTTESNESINESYSENESTENVTKVPSDAEIILDLNYADESEFDTDNDGIETREGIIDFKVDAEFNWEVNDNNLCTIWETYSVDNKTSIKICYGAETCCNFAGLESNSEKWNEIFYSYYQRYGATENNEISAQVVYADYNTSEENLYSDIYYSNWQTLNAVFIDEEEITSITEECIETCSFSSNKTGYRIRVEVEDTRFNLQEIVYTIIPSEKKPNKEPVLIKSIPNITIGRGGYYVLNLSEYFIDEDSESLDYKFYETDNISETIQGDIVNITPEEEFTGKRHTFIIANDSESIAVSNVFEIDVIERNLTSEDIAIVKEINKPIKWRKNLLKENYGNVSKEFNITFKLDGYAFNISVFDKQLDKKINDSLINIKDNEKSVVFKDLIDAKKTKEYYVEYETPGPVSYENEISPARKRIVVSSDINYTGVLAYTNITEITSDSSNIRLYWVKNNTRELFENISYIDQDNDLLIDRIEWIVPHFSNQTFEVEVDAISVYSNPSSNNNWTISFNVTGISNLSVRASNGTSYAEVFNDNNSTKDDLEIVELKCGNKTVYNRHSLENSFNFYFRLKNDSSFKLSETIGKSLEIDSIFVEDFVCNSTSNLTVNLISPGEHYLEFDFHGVKAYAKNIPTDIIKTENVYYNSNCPKCEKDYDLNPESFCLMTDHWQEKDDFQAEMSFNIKYVEGVNSAYLCAYNHYNWHGEESINYIEKVNESKLSVVPEEFVINNSFIKINVPSSNGWQCFNITGLVKESIENNETKLNLRWIGENINGSRGPFACFRGVAPLERCDGYNPSGAFDCRPYLDIR